MATTAGGEPNALMLLVRAFGAAFDLKSWTIAVLALFALQLGGDVLGQGRHTLPIADASRREALKDEGAVRAFLVDAARATSRPAQSLIRPVLHGLDPTTTTADRMRAVGAGLWVLLVWGVGGSLIVRNTLVHVTTPWTGAAVSWPSARQIGTILGAPLIPILLGLPFWLALVGTGLVLKLVGGSGVLASLLGVLPMAAGLVLAVLTIGVVVGWPLMVVAVVAETEDAFDAFSRSFGYLLQKPLSVLFYLAIAGGLGLIGMSLVTLVVEFGLLWVDYGVGGALEGSNWPTIVRFVATAWAETYAWSAMSVIYLLLRREVDGTAWDEIRRPAL